MASQTGYASAAAAAVGGWNAGQNLLDMCATAGVRDLAAAGTKRGTAHRRPPDVDLMTPIYPMGYWSVTLARDSGLLRVQYVADTPHAGRSSGLGRLQ